jgi:hypothetical protein
MNDFAGDNSDFQWDRRTQELKDISRSLELVLSNNGVNATVKENGNLRIEISDLLLGPRNFRPTSV